MYEQSCGRIRLIYVFFASKRLQLKGVCKFSYEKEERVECRESQTLYTSGIRTDQSVPRFSPRAISINRFTICRNGCSLLFGSCRLYYRSVVGTYLYYIPTQIPIVYVVPAILVLSRLKTVRAAGQVYLLGIVYTNRTRKWRSNIEARTKRDVSQVGYLHGRKLHHRSFRMKTTKRNAFGVRPSAAAAFVYSACSVASTSPYK